MMFLNATRWFVLLNLVRGVVLDHRIEGMYGDADDELPKLRLDGVDREPQDGRIELEDIEKGVGLKCKLVEEGESESKKENEQTVKDREWKWVRVEKNETGEEYDVPQEGQVTSELNVKEAIKGFSGWIRFRCLSAEKFADFLVDAGNKTKKPRLPFQVKKYEKSYNVVEKEDFSMYCEILNKTAMNPDESEEEGKEKLKKELNVRWYRWSEPEDMSYVPEETDEPVKPNCTSESMNGTKWELMTTSKLNENDAEPHIKMLKREGEHKEWGFKVEDAVKNDRRGYKCVVYNISQPENCSESVFFLRVKDKYAALWPFIGIVVEVVVLVAVIFICEHRRNTKEEFEDEGLNGNGVGVGGRQSGSGENSSVRNRRQ